jgi:hypothetical protein
MVMKRRFGRRNWPFTARWAADGTPQARYTMSAATAERGLQASAQLDLEQSESVLEPPVEVAPTEPDPASDEMLSDTGGSGLPERCQRTGWGDTGRVVAVELPPTPLVAVPVPESRDLRSSTEPARGLAVWSECSGHAHGPAPACCDTSGRCRCEVSMVHS